MHVAALSALLPTVCYKADAIRSGSLIKLPWLTAFLSFFMNRKVGPVDRLMAADDVVKPANNREHRARQNCVFRRYRRRRESPSVRRTTSPPPPTHTQPNRKQLDCHKKGQGGQPLMNRRDGPDIVTRRVSPELRTGV